MSILNSGRQTGLSMVELLVALAVSSFLILGITQVYIDNKRNYVFQQNQANNQENARFAEFMLMGLINKAGYRRAPDQAIEYAFPEALASADCAAFAEGAAITALQPTAGSGEVGLCMRYQPAVLGERDCQGNAVKSVTGTSLDTAFVKPKTDELVVLAIKFVPDAELEQGTLQCKNLSGTAPEFVELLEGVADVSFEFATGEDDLFEKRLKENPWSDTASGIVRAVRYSVLLASRPNQRDGDSRVYSNWVAAVLNAANKARLEAGDERRVYQVAGSTQTLRNMMP